MAENIEEVRKTGRGNRVLNSHPGGEHESSFYPETKGYKDFLEACRKHDVAFECKFTRGPYYHDDDVNLMEVEIFPERPFVAMNLG